MAESIIVPDKDETLVSKILIQLPFLVDQSEFCSRFLFKFTWGAHRQRSKTSLVPSKTLMPLPKNLKHNRDYGFPLQPAAELELEATLLRKHIPRLKIIPPKKPHLGSDLNARYAAPIAIPKPKRQRINPRSRVIGKLKRQRINPRPRVVQQAGPDPPDLPTQFQLKINGLNGQDLKLVIQKRLSKTDMRPYFARLSIPEGQMRTDFLSQGEHTVLEQREANGINYEGMKVHLIEPSLAESTIVLKRWKLGSGKSYMLSSGWQKVAVDNGLKPDDIIQLWSFRVNQSLRFALVKLLDY